MKLAIHARKGSFSDRWVSYCEENGVDYKIVDCFSDGILDDIKGCNALLWHWSHLYISDLLFARSILKVVSDSGVKVYPNIDTCWYFDDKVSQKYILESLDVPKVKTYSFFSKKTAEEWAEKQDFPKVFKLKGGAGSSNVKLARNLGEAKALIRKSFSKGFSPISRWGALSEKLWHFKRDKTLKSFLSISKGIFRFLKPHPAYQALPHEKGYVYFQEFIPKNTYDIRVIVIGKRAFAIKRMVRKGDFRASGSGMIVYKHQEIPLECVKLTFEIAEKLKTQSLAVDFVFKDDQPLVVELSYGFTSKAYYECPGYWTPDLTWNECKFKAEDFIIEDLLEEL